MELSATTNYQILNSLNPEYQHFQFSLSFCLVQKHLTETAIKETCTPKINPSELLIFCRQLQQAELYNRPTCPLYIKKKK